MGLARLTSESVTCRKRWDLERRLDRAGWKRPKAWRMRRPMSAFDFKAMILAWLDNYDSPDGILPHYASEGYDSYADMIEDVAQYDGPEGTLWSSLLEARYIDEDDDGEGFRWHDYRHYNARAINARVNGRKGGRPTKAATDGGTDEETQTKTQQRTERETGRGKGRGSSSLPLKEADSAQALARKWNEIAKRNGLPQVRSLSVDRKRHILAFLAACPSFRVAVAACEAAAESYAGMATTRKYGLFNLIRPARREAWISQGEEALALDTTHEHAENSAEAIEQRAQVLRDLRGQADLIDAAKERWKKAGLKWR